MKEESISNGNLFVDFIQKIEKRAIAHVFISDLINQNVNRCVQVCPSDELKEKLNNAGLNGGVDYTLIAILEDYFLGGNKFRK